MDLTSQSKFERLKRQLPEIQSALGELGIDAWLLYDLHARNNVAARTLELGDLTRRYFVVVPAQGEPVAVTHGIEQLAWKHWPWRNEVFVGWQPLGDTLKRVLQPYARVAMEISERDAVPAMDLVPYGVVELVRASGPDVVTSAELVTRFYARWSRDDFASHTRAAAVLAQVAQAAFKRLAQEVGAGNGPTESDLQRWVVADLAAHGVGVEAECIPATGINAANPHYGPIDGGATFRTGDVVLLDLWAKESEHAIFADQTWMAYLGERVPDDVARIFHVVRDARNAAVEFLEQSWRAGRIVQGREVDDVTRRVIREAGYGEQFIHRTGHSIDQATHGMGPNIDNFETSETRRLIPGVGFSIEPGIYIPGFVGIRSEINVFMSDDGPVVTTPGPQESMLELLPAG